MQASGFLACLKVGIENGALGCCNAGSHGLSDDPKARGSSFCNSCRRAAAHDVHDVQRHVGELCKLDRPEGRLLLQCIEACD